MKEGRNLSSPESCGREEHSRSIGTAVILCGGKSRRAGRDKQLLRVEGRLMALHIAGKLASLFDHILLVTNRPELYGNSPYEVIEDIHKEWGPLGGLHAGLCSARSSFVYLTACDMPNVCLPGITWMTRKLAEEGYRHDAAVVRRDNGYTEPLHGLYARRLLPRLEQAIAGGTHRILSACGERRILYLEERDIRPFAGGQDLFLNLNSPGDIDNFFLWRGGQKISEGA